MTVITTGKRLHVLKTETVSCFISAKDYINCQAKKPQFLCCVQIMGRINDNQRVDVHNTHAGTVVIKYNYCRLAPESQLALICSLVTIESRFQHHHRHLDRYRDLFVCLRLLRDSDSMSTTIASQRGDALLRAKACIKIPFKYNKTYYKKVQREVPAEKVLKANAFSSAINCC